MGLAFLFSGLSLGRRTRLERVARQLLVISGVAVIGVLVTLALIFGKDLEYRFEVIALSIDWIVLVVAGALLGVVFKRLMRGSPPAPHIPAKEERFYVELRLRGANGSQYVAGSQRSQSQGMPLVGLAPGAFVD